MTTQVVYPEAGAAMAAGVIAALDVGALPARIDLYAGATFVCSTNLAKPCGAVVGGTLVLTVPTSGAIAYAGLAPTQARLYSGAGVRLFDLRARMLGAADDPADPAAVVVQATVVDAGALIRITAGTLAFA